MIHDLTEKIMSNVGLDVDDKFRLVDQDYGILIMFNEKYLKCSCNNEEPIISNDDIYFDPIRNIKLMIFIFSYFIQKHQVLTGNYIMSWCQIYNDHHETALNIKGTNEITSNYYKSEVLAYIDIIFKLSGYNNSDFLKKYESIIK